MPSKCFNLNGKIDLPIDVSISCVKDKYLVIAPKKGTYIVLDSIQLEFLKFLMKRNTLRELLNSRHYNKELYPKLQNLLIQFEVRKFYESHQPKPNKQLSARLYLTNACNLRCIHCYRYSGNKENNELNFYDWKDILEKLKENGIQDISISGGEPFIFNKIYKLIDYAVDNLGMNVRVLSNGTKIDFNYISTLKKLKDIQLSIDGPTEKVNDQIRGKGVYFKVLKALDKLCSEGISVTLSMVLFDKYFNEYKIFMESFLKKLNNKYGNSVKIRFTTGILPGRNISKDKKVTFYNNSLQSFIDIVCEKVYGREWLFQSNHNLTNLNLHTNCGYGCILTIDPTGKIYPCNLTDSHIGDIHNDNISDVILKLKELNENLCVDNLEPCSRCDMRYICGGTCRVMNNYLYDNMLETKCGDIYSQELRRVLVEGYSFLYIKGDIDEEAK